MRTGGFATRVLPCVVIRRPALACKASRLGGALAAALVIASVAPAVASADVKPLGLTCVPTEGVRFCDATAGTSTQAGQEIYDPRVRDTRVASWDGTPLDVNVTLPPHGDTNLPLIILIHGYVSVKSGLDSGMPIDLGTGTRTWARRGYAVLTFSMRGQGDSCGPQAALLANPSGCAKGWSHLDDVRYEARDAQWLASLLADEGIIEPQRIGVAGISWGGGLTPQLAMLRDRIMLPDGSLVPWVSPQRHLPMRIAAAVPYLGWTDMSYAVLPNGRTLDYTVTGFGDDTSPAGVGKASILNSLGGALEAQSRQAPPGMPPNLAEWVGMADLGPPVASDENPLFVSYTNEKLHYHSAYYLPYNEPPAPTLFVNGFTDAIFPVDEALRWINRERLEQPSAHIALMVGDFGHQPAQTDGKPGDIPLRRSRIFDWMDHYVKGDSTPVLHGVQATTLTCPETAPSGGPYYADSWNKIHPGEVRLKSAVRQTIVSTSGDSTVDLAIDPIAAAEVDPNNSQCVSTAPRHTTGTASYRLSVAGKGFTLLGSPTVIARLKRTGADPPVVAHLWDVSPGGKRQTLIARGVYRPSADGRQVFQLHPAGWFFAHGHTVRLDLQGQDAPYSKPDAVPGTIAVNSLELRLPTAEKPNCRQILSPAPPLVAPGETLVPGVHAHPPRGCRGRRHRKRG